MQGSPKVGACRKPCISSPAAPKDSNITALFPVCAKALKGAVHLVRIVTNLIYVYILHAL